MAESHEEFTKRLLRDVAIRAANYARPSVRAASEQLEAAMRVYVSETWIGSARVYIPHFWALYVHDGRGPFGPTEGRIYLCWFRDPREDPRLYDGKQPERRAQVRHLTREQWYYYLGLNREARKNRQPEPMIVTRYYPFPTYPKRFFDNGPGGGMAGFSRTIGPVIKEDFRAHMMEHFADVLHAEATLTIGV